MFLLIEGFIDIFKPFTWLLIENKVQFLVFLIFYIEIFLLETIKTFCFEKENREIGNCRHLQKSIYHLI